MSRVLVIGCGGVANVAVRKCCQVSDVFSELCIASRTKAKCDALAAALADKTETKITTAEVNADNVQEVIGLIRSYRPELVMNIALPYQDLTIMDACLRAAFTIWILQTMSRKIRTIPRGAKFMRSAVRKRDFRHISITVGSGRTAKDSRKRGLLRFSAAALIPVSHRHIVHTQKSTNSTVSIPSISLTAMAVIMDILSQQISIPR